MNKTTTAPESYAASADAAQRLAKRALWLSRGIGALAIVLLAVWSLIEQFVPSDVGMASDFGVLAFVAGTVFYAATRSRRAHVEAERAHFAHVAELACRDAMSGLYNYRYFHDRLADDIVECAARHAPCALIMLDLNNFKEVNDRFGHPAGDTLLTAIGRAAADLVAERGTVARYGGDEFAIILPNVNAVEAKAIAEAVSHAIVQASISATPLNRNVRVGAAFGIAVFPDEAQDSESLIVRADTALYRQKEDVRDERKRAEAEHAQSVFFAIGEAMGRSLADGETVQNLVRAVGDSLHLDACAIRLVQSDGNMPLLARHVPDPKLLATIVAVEEMYPMTLESYGLHQPYIDDLASQPSLPEAYRRNVPANAWVLRAPIGGERPGVLTLGGIHGRAEPPPSSLAAAIARLAAAAIQNADMFEDARRQNDHLSRLAGIGGYLFGTGDLERRLGDVVRHIGEVTGYEMVTIDTADPAEERPFLRHFYGRDEDGIELPDDDEGVRAWRSMRPVVTEPSIAEFLAKVREPLIMKDVSEVPESYREVIVSGGIQSVVVVPINWRGELMGMLYFASRHKHAFGPQDLTLMQSVAAQLAPALQVAVLHVQLERSYEELREAHLDAILRLAHAAEARDPFTGRHLQRIKAFSTAIGRRMGLGDAEVEAIGYGGVVHDLGKLRIPDSILIKAGELTEDEWRVMKQHPEFGAELLGASEFYDPARQVALHHHERWDGSGYPHGLAGEDIPLAARIVSVADVYDALTSDRPYKRAWHPSRALAELLDARGKTLCPRSVDTFLQLWNEGVIAAIEAETGGPEPHFLDKAA